MGEDINKNFKTILLRAEHLNLTIEQLCTLQCGMFLTTKQSEMPKIYCDTTTYIRRHAVLVSSVLIVLFAVCISISAVDWPISKRKVIEIWLHQDMDVEKEPCLIMNREGFGDLARPPVDCGICSGIKDIDRVSNLKPDSFEDQYAYSGRPVVITDGMSAWTASETFSFMFFKSIYASDSPVLQNVEQNCQFFPYKTAFESLGEVFNMSSDRADMKDGSKPWYVGW